MHKSTVALTVALIFSWIAFLAFQLFSEDTVQLHEPHISSLNAARMNCSASLAESTRKNEELLFEIVELERSLNASLAAIDDRLSDTEASIEDEDPAVVDPSSPTSYDESKLPKWYHKWKASPLPQFPRDRPPDFKTYDATIPRLHSTLKCEGDHDDNRVCVYENLYWDTRSGALMFYSNETDPASPHYLHELPRVRSSTYNDPKYCPLDPVSISRDAEWRATHYLDRSLYGIWVHPIMGNFHHCLSDHFYPLYGMISRDQGTPWAIDPTQTGILWLTIPSQNSATCLPGELVNLLTDTIQFPQRNGAYPQRVMVKRLVLGLAGYSPELNEGYNWHRLRNMQGLRPVEEQTRALNFLGDYIPRSLGFGSKLDWSTSIAQKPGKIFVVNRAGTRSMLNADELVRKLVEHFPNEVHPEVVDMMAQGGLVNQIKLIRDARMVISTHGALWVHTAWMRPGTIGINLEYGACVDLQAHRVRIFCEYMRVPYRLWANTNMLDVTKTTPEMVEQMFTAVDSWGRAASQAYCMTESIQLSQRDIDRAVEIVRESLAHQEDHAAAYFHEMVRIMHD